MSELMLHLCYSYFAQTSCAVMFVITSLFGSDVLRSHEGLWYEVHYSSRPTVYDSLHAVELSCYCRQKRATQQFNKPKATVLLPVQPLYVWRL